MMQALAVLSVMIALSTPPPNVNAPNGMLGCEYAQSWRSTNLPFAGQGDASIIDHSAAIIYSGDAVGWLFQVRSGSVYYQDGPVGIRYRYHQAAPGDIAEKVLSLLTSRHDPDKLQKGTIYPVIGVNVSALGDSKITMEGCF